MPRHKASPTPLTRHGQETKKRAPGSVRLISGRWKGRKLPVRDVEGLRPTTDRVKETLFNWLATDIRDSRCLDLFAGSGSLGFEALSRYAAYVMMVELDKGAAAQLTTNMATLACNQGKVVQQDALTLLNGKSEPFDIIFLDPPFRRDLLESVCTLLEERGWLADELARHPKLVVLGDFNIAPDARDVHDPAVWNDEHILTSTAERDALRALLGLGLHDAFRLHHDEADVFSWWDYRAAGFRRNLGLRIDLTLVSDALRAAATEAGIDREPRTWDRPSDHAPAWVQLA